MTIRINLDSFIEWQLTGDISEETLKEIVEDSWRHGAFPLSLSIRTAADYFAEYEYIPKHIVVNWDELSLKTEEEEKITAEDLNDLYKERIEWT